MKKFMLASALALACSTAPTQASTTITFAGGSSDLPVDSKVIQDFDALAVGSSIGSNASVYATTGIAAARPAFGSTGNYGAVNSGGTFVFDFAASELFAFIIGSLDTYNSLLLRYADGSSTLLTGGAIVDNSSLFDSGNRTINDTNGSVSYRVTSGPLLTGATFTSNFDAFEFDNMAVAVPEPAAWAMMIFGFALVGGSLRRRPTVKVNFA